MCSACYLLDSTTRGSQSSPFSLPNTYNASLPALSHPFPSAALTEPLQTLQILHSTLQIASSLSSAHCPSRDHMDGLLTGSPTVPETQPYKRLLDAVCARLSICSSRQISPAPAQPYLSSILGRRDGQDVWSSADWRKSYMLVYEQNGDVFTILREALKGFFDGSVFGLLVDHEEVLLGVRRGGDVLLEVSQSRGRRYGTEDCVLQRQRGGVLSRSPRLEISGLALVGHWQRMSETEEFGKWLESTSSPITARNCRSLYAAMSSDTAAVSRM